jgi:hypothetical protein
MVEIETEGKRKFYKDFDSNKIYVTDIVDNNGNKVYVTDTFVNISYNCNLIVPLNRLSCVLSNLYPRDRFYFKNHIVKSVEGVLQGLRFQDIDVQTEAFSLYGRDAYAFGAVNFGEDDWRKTGVLYFDGKEINRYSIEYQQFLNELYLSLLNVKSFAEALKNTGNKELIHLDGKLNPTETILTPKEYILRLEYMRDYLINKTDEKAFYKKLDTLAVIIAEEQAKIVYQKRLN